MNDNANGASTEAPEGMTIAAMNLHVFDGAVLYRSDEGMVGLEPGRIIVPADDAPPTSEPLNDAERGGFELLGVNPMPTHKVRFGRAMIVEASGPTPNPNLDSIAYFNGLTLYTAVEEAQVSPLRVVPSIVAAHLGGEPIRSESIAGLDDDDLFAMRAIYMTLMMQQLRAEHGESEHPVERAKREMEPVDNRSAKVWMQVVGGGRHKVLLTTDDGFLVTRKIVVFMEPDTEYTLEPISECQLAAVRACDPTAKPDYLLTIQNGAYTEDIGNGRSALAAGEVRLLVEKGTRIETRTAWLPRLPFDAMGYTKYLDTSEEIPPKAKLREAMRELVSTVRAGEA